jgi:nucleoside-diphosphate-sugar epimerase
MRIMVLGAGKVGVEGAARAGARGWEVVATTTTPARVAELEPLVDEVVVLVGSDTEAVKAAADGVDAILVAASPRIMQSVTVEDRARSYRDVLVASCESAAAACDRVLFLSSISVYGDGPQPLRMVHEHMGGSTAFAGDGRLHRVNVEDVARAVLHVFDNDLTGVYNCVPDLVPPPTNREAFDMLADRAGLPHIEFRDELRTPTQQVVSAKLRATGFVFEHPDDELQ